MRRRKNCTLRSTRRRPRQTTTSASCAPIKECAAAFIVRSPHSDPRPRPDRRADLLTRPHLLAPPASGSRDRSASTGTRQHQPVVSRFQFRDARPEAWRPPLVHWPHRPVAERDSPSIRGGAPCPSTDPARMTIATRGFCELAVRLLVKHPTANVSTRLRIEQPDRGRGRDARVRPDGRRCLRREQLRLDHAARYRLGPLQLARAAHHADEHDDDQGLWTHDTRHHFSTKGRGP